MMSPYIKKEARATLDYFVNSLPYGETLSWGELNYIITKILLKTEPKSYADYNALIGVLECVKLEFYARAVRPYEDKKCEENGDVY